MSRLVEDMDVIGDAVANLTASASRPPNADDVAASDDGGAGARCVEILPGGSESVAVGGAVVEARTVEAETELPPIATCMPVDDGAAAPNVVVCQSFVLPAGGLVELQYALTVEMEVVDAQDVAPKRLKRDADGRWKRAPAPLVEGENFSVDAFPA